MEPAAEADERASGPEDIADPVQQPAPAAQRLGVGQMPDRLLDQGPQPCLQPVERPLLIGEPVLGPPVPDRIQEALAPLRGQLPDHELRRLVHAIAAMVGIEALVWLTDIAGLSGQQAVEVMRWSAETLLHTALTDADAAQR